MCQECYEGVNEILNGKKQVKCNACKGDGVYKWGAMVNGKASHTGKCFACAGKGHQNKSDILRKNSYYNHRVQLF